MEKGKMIVKEVCGNSSGSESDDIGRLIRETELNMKSGGDEDQDVKVVVKSQSLKKGRYHRHTPEQVQEMEMLFKEFSHPSDKQKRELSVKLGMQPLQVKFWFQNKRNQMKAQHKHRENLKLRIENEKLQAENMRLKEALSNAACATCGGSVGILEMSLEEFQLKQDNVELMIEVMMQTIKNLSFQEKEIDHISSLVAGYVGKPLSPQ